MFISRQDELITGSMAKKRLRKVRKKTARMKSSNKPKSRSASIERVTTGIPGLDKLLEGGFIRGDTVLVTGATGTGKTIFCAQYIWEGLKNGEKCLFVTLEESAEDILNDIARFGWNFRHYIESGQLKMISKDPLRLTNEIGQIVEMIKRNRLHRVVIDSTSVMGLYFKNPFELRKQMFQIFKDLKETGATIVATAETPEGGKGLSRFGVEEYVVDGVVVMHYLEYAASGTPRSLIVRKMRRTAHKTDIFPMKITDKGIEVMAAKRGIVI